MKVATSLVVVACVFLCVVPSAQADLRGSAEGTHRRNQQQVNVGEIAALRLIDADTDLPIANYDPLTTNAVIDLGKISAKNLNIEAIVSGTVTSLQWDVNGAVRTEEVAPWAICGNRGQDFFVCAKLKVGYNATVKVTPYSGPSASGTAGTSRTMSIAIVQSNVTRTPNPPTLTFVNPNTDSDIGILVDGTEVMVGSPPYEYWMTIRADPDPAFASGSVQFSLDGSVVRVENNPPYVINGNQGYDYSPWDTMPIGEHTVTATVYAGKDATGSIVSTYSAKCKFIFRICVIPPTAPIPVGRDVTLPVLLNFTLLSPSIVDVTNGPVLLDGLIVGQDDRDSWYRREFIVICKGQVGEGTYRIRSNAGEVVSGCRGGEPTSWRDVLTIPKLYVPNGKCQLEVDIADNASNRAIYGADKLTALGSSSEITVVNSQGNWLVNLTATSPTTLSQGEVTFSVTTKTTKSDYRQLYLFYPVNGTEEFAFEYRGVSDPVTDTTVYSFTIAVGTTWAKGRYPLKLRLLDGIFDEIIYTSEDLNARGFPSAFTIA